MIRQADPEFFLAGPDFDVKKKEKEAPKKVGPGVPPQSPAQAKGQVAMREIREAEVQLAERMCGYYDYPARATEFDDMYPESNGRRGP
jgi:hypothetical protein